MGYDVLELLKIMIDWNLWREPQNVQNVFIYIHPSQLAWYIHHKSMLVSLRLPTYLFFGPMFCSKHWIISGPSFQPGLIPDQVSSSRTSLENHADESHGLSQCHEPQQLRMVGASPKFGASKTGTIGNTKQKKARTNTVYGSLQLRCCF